MNIFILGEKTSEKQELFVFIKIIFAQLRLKEQFCASISLRKHLKVTRARQRIVSAVSIFRCFQEVFMPTTQTDLRGGGRACFARSSMTASLDEISTITRRIGERATRLRTQLESFDKSDTLRQMRSLLDSIK